ncbi:aldehyde dehydrogenase family protein [Roseomonas mucosa]|uniref:aldehyde dehydrogenase family protein n=1 Tax=Roseomonas mucosa TaxID=207340 RepID=UPI0028CE550B|nr:aldehyde dehydrogenase family protein [Roseomonas mucosa]MDT8275735.1 aldehyde dehydrogenase family protein [Roseomonas mucosa]
MLSDTIGAHPYLRSDRPMFIAGRWVHASDGATIDVINPATEEVICTIPRATKEDVGAAVTAARRAFDEGSWRCFKPMERERILYRLADLLEKHADELAFLECLDNGKPRQIARERDIKAAITRLRYMAGWPSKLEGRVLRPSYNVPDATFHAFNVREPIGVVAQIVPWNFPLQMAVGKLAPALAAGCTCVLKPAELTSLTALRLGELVSEAEFPAGTVNIITGDASTGAFLVEHPGIDKIAFTGSTSVGLEIGTKAISRLKRVSLELGGKSPVIIGPDADLASTIPAVANAIFYNGGQVCIAGSRLYAHASVFDRIVSGIADIARSLRLGNGMDPATQQGPLISRNHMNRVLDHIDSGRSDGTVVVGGRRHGNAGYFVEPTVIVDLPEGSRCVREEIFGPVLVATPYENEDDVIRAANDTEYGLAASVWSRDLPFAMRVASRIKAGNVWINSHGLQDAAIPFGGFKKSGIGRENSSDGVLLYTEAKSTIMRI